MPFLNERQLEARIVQLEAALVSTTALFLARFEKVEKRAMRDVEKEAILLNALLKAHRDAIEEEAAARDMRNRVPAVAQPQAPPPGRLSTEASIKVVVNYLLHHEEARTAGGKVNWTSLARLHPVRNNRAWASFYQKYSKDIQERVTAGHAAGMVAAPAA